MSFGASWGRGLGLTKCMQIEMDQQAQEAEDRMKQAAMRNGNGNGPPR